MNSQIRAIVMTSAANMPSSCWGRYGNVAVVLVDFAVLETEGLQKPRMISDRAKGVVRIVSYWGKLNRGLTAACAFEKVRAKAIQIAEEINSQSVA